jgi:hypothetical protein
VTTSPASRFRVVAAIICLALCWVQPAVAQVPSTKVVLSGIVRASDGAVVPGTTVTIAGPENASVTTSGSGEFSVSVIPGVYAVRVERGGFNPFLQRDVVLSAGSTPTLNITLARSDLSALRTIGSVTSSGRGAASLNTSTSNASFVPAAAFQNLADTQINAVLQRIPDVTVQYLGGKPDTTIIVGGAQPYETQVLIDGHPLALGKSGVWTSTYFPSFLIGGVETQSGPGNTTPFANLAVGGTANLLTPSFTTKPTLEAVTGVDSYGSQFSNLLATGSAGRLAYVLGTGVGGLNGPYFKKTACSVSADNYLNDNTPASTGTLQFCGDASSSLIVRGTVAKLRYNFTPSTSLDFGFVGAWGAYIPQATNFGNTIGPTKILPCLSPPLQLQCTNPAYGNLIGKTINAVYYFPSAYEYNNQTLFDAQFRTSLGNNTLLIRPYLGDIEPESALPGGQGSYPLFFAPVGADPTAFANFCSNSFGNPNGPNGSTIVVNRSARMLANGLYPIRTR